MYNSKLLDSIFKSYDIPNLKFGIIGDKLGDSFEDFIVKILENTHYLSVFNQSSTLDEFDYDIFKRLLNSFHLNENSKIERIAATSHVVSRITGGLPKTDVIADVYFADGKTIALPISVKQSTVPKVAFAEFDVDTIVEEVGISNQRLIELFLKHQTDASAKNFTPSEKAELVNALLPYSHKFVQWVITGSPTESDDLRIPKAIIKFNICKNTFQISKYDVFTIDEYIDHIMLDKKGNPRRGGFGTGLSWTYATGSKGKKIQFKG